jgi:hypothetical protein
VRAGVLANLLLALFALLAAAAAAEPASGPREAVNESFTSRTPNTATGMTYTGSYHAAGDPNGDPPYLRRMVFSPPRGMRFDTSVPDRCTATDIELEAMGPDACPAGSRLGEGTTDGLFWAPVTHAFLVDHFNHHLDILNNANEQIMLVHSEGYTVVRGRMQPDGSTIFDSTTCFPASPTGQCPDDYILQLKSATSILPYTKTEGGRTRNYATTPRTCPLRGYWATTISFWWADGATDKVVSRQPCDRPA